MKVLITFSFVFLLLGCSAQEDELRVGVILHLTNNDYVNVAQGMQEGIELAANEATDSGRKVSLIYEDDQNNIVQAVNAANKLLEADNIDVALISTFGETMAAGPIFEKKKVPLIVLWDSNKELENLGDYVFSTGVWTANAGERIADFSRTDLNITNMTIIYHQTEWSTAVKQYFVESFEERNGTILGEHPISEGTTDFRQIILKGTKDNPQAIFAPIDRNIGTFFKQLKESGYAGVVLSSDAITQGAIDSAQGGLEGAYYTVFAVPKSGQAEKFKQKYKEAYKKEPTETIYVAMGYDGMKSILEATKNGPSDPESIKKALYTLQGVEGSFGKLTFSKEGSAPKTESIFQVQNGTEVFIKE